MKTITGFDAWCIILLCLTLVFFKFNAMASMDDEEQTITGTVVEATQNDSDSISVAIAGPSLIETEDDPLDEAYWLVADNEKGRELASLIGHQVRAKGIIEVDENGVKTIQVKEFVLAEPEEGT